MDWGLRGCCGMVGGGGTMPFGLIDLFPSFTTDIFMGV